jgi:hypothetical protein
MILIIVPLISQEINDNDKKDWDKLTDIEKWESYKIAHNSYIRLKALYDRSANRTDDLINENERLQKLINKKYKKNSLGLSIIAGIDYDKLTIECDCYVFLIYKRYFLYNTGYFQFGGGFKFYDDYGGAALFGLGFNF